MSAIPPQADPRKDAGVTGAAAPSVAGVVLAAGQGKRMRSELPKVLHKVMGAPMIRFPLDALDGAGVGRKVVVLGVGREKVEAYLAPRKGVTVAVQDAPLGTGHALQAARTAVGDAARLVVLSGDAPCVTDGTVRAALAALDAEGADAIVVTTRTPAPRGYGRIVRDVRNGRLARIVEEKDATDAERRIEEINSGLYAFRTAKLWPALDMVRPENDAKEYYLTDAVRNVLSLGGAVGTIEAPYAEVEGVNDRVQLAQAAQVVRARILETLMRDVGVTIVDPSTTHIEVDVKVGPDTIIEPFTVVRSGARIGGGCHVGPFAHIAEGATLEDTSEIGNFVEVKRSRMGKKAKAKHLAYIGDATVGAGVNIGAGTIFCNYDGRAKHASVVGERAFIGSGTLLVAPVEVGESAVLGAGAVVTRGKKVPAGETWVGMPARPVARPGAGGKP